MISQMNFQTGEIIVSSLVCDDVMMECFALKMSLFVMDPGLEGVLISQMIGTKTVSVMLLVFFHVL